tara:strand:+ start:144 stop:341 length:198 start_codon:yes stop_codon:yes gene_type:complete
MLGTTECNREYNEGVEAMKFTEAIARILSFQTDSAALTLDTDACDVIEDFMEQWSGAIKEMEERK